MMGKEYGIICSELFDEKDLKRRIDRLADQGYEVETLVGLPHKEKERYYVIMSKNF